MKNELSENAGQQDARNNDKRFGVDILELCVLCVDVKLHVKPPVLVCLCFRVFHFLIVYVCVWVISMVVSCKSAMKNAKRLHPNTAGGAVIGTSPSVS